MAVTKQQMQNAINSYKKQGKTDNEIIIALSKRKDAIGLSFADDMKHGTVEEFAEVFGLEYDRSPVDVNNAVNKNATLWDKTKDTAQSFAVGVADTTGNVAKGFYGLTDKVGLTKGAKEQYQKDVKNETSDVVAVEPLPPTTQQSPIQPSNLADLSLPSQDTSYLEKLGQPIDIGGMPTPSNMPSGPVDFGGDVGNTGENVGYGENPEYGGVSGDYQNTGYQAVAEPKSQVALGNIAQGLYDLIPPPKETDNPRKQAVFEQFASSMVGRVLDTPQLQKIVDEFDNDEPNLRKIKALQKQLERTPEWQSLLNTMPKEQRKHGSEILQYLTNGQIHDNSGMFNPTF